MVAIEKKVRRTKQQVAGDRMARAIEAYAKDQRWSLEPCGSETCLSGVCRLLAARQRWLKTNG